MTPYGNLSGNSGVVAFSVDDNSINIQFRDSSKLYVYDGTKPGSLHVERMKELAAAGRGLGTYISQNVKKNYARVE